MFLDVVLLSERTGTVQRIYFDGVSLFLPIVVMKHWACLFLLFIQQPRGTARFLQGEEEERERKKTAGHNFFITIN